MQPIEIRLLGPIELRLEGRTLDLGTRKQRALFGLLAVNRNRTVSTDRIMTSLWGADAPTARRNDVWVYMSRLRTALGSASGILSRSGDGYSLTANDDAVDAHRFEALIEQAKQVAPSDPAATSHLLNEALASWSGDPLGEFRDDEWAHAEVVRLEELHLSAVEARLAADLSWRDPSDVLVEAEALAATHPMRPALVASLMRARYGAGRQADALAAYRTFATALAEETGLAPPSDLAALEERILLDDPSVRPGRPLPRTIPDRLVELVGRKADLDTIAARVDASRIVTLVGAGGVGKTTLALEVARRHHDAFAGIGIVDAALVDDPEDIELRIAEALGMAAGGAITAAGVRDHLAGRRTLLILDNCETHREACAAALDELIAQVPPLSVVATSRKRLGIEGEHVVHVEPLDDDASTELLTHLLDTAGGSIAMLTGDERARAVTLTGGLPLGIELIAAQLSRQPSRDVLGAHPDGTPPLSDVDRFGDDRHRDMDVCIGLSESMVPVMATAVFHRLAVLRGSFTSRTARAVCAFGAVDAHDVDGALGELVAASLIEFDPGTNRYRLLEPVRQYAMRRLDELGEADLAADRMAAHVIDDLCDVAWEDTSPGTSPHEDANIRAAIRRAIVTGDADLARRGCSAAIKLWRATADLAGVLPLIEQALDLDDEPTRTRAALLMRSIPVIALVERWDAAKPRIEALQAIAGTSDDPEVRGWAALRTADDLAVGAGDIDAAIEEYRRAIDLLRDAGTPEVTRAYHQAVWAMLWAWDRWEEAEALADDWLTTCLSHGWDDDVAAAESYLAWLSAARGRTHEIEVHAATAQDIYRRLGDHRQAAITLGVLEYASLQRGDLDEALRRGEVALQAAREMGAVPWVNGSLIDRAPVLAAVGRSEEARACVAEAGSTILAFEEFGDTAVLADVAARVVAADDPALAAALVGAARSPDRTQRIGLDTERIVLPALDATVGDPTADLATRLGHDAHAKASERFASLDDRAVIAHIVHAMGVRPAAG